MVSPPPGSSDDGWTHVGKGRKKDSNNFRPKRAPVDCLLTLKKLTAEFEARRKLWRADGTCRRELLEILDRVKPDAGWQVSTAVCLASGSFCRDNLELRRRSLLQFVAFMDVVRYLQESSSTPIQLFVQDPAYADLDKEFLSSLGASVLDVLDDGSQSTGLALAQQHIGPGCFVFEPFLDVNYDAVVTLFGSDITLFIGSCLKHGFASGGDRHGKAENHKAPSTDNEQSERARAYEIVKQFRDNHDFYNFPMFEEDPNVFDGLQVYWKKATDDDEDE